MARFTFTNYIPRNEFEHYANHRLARIAESMPYCASVEAEATRIEDEFHFLVCFNSMQGTFTSTATIKPDSRSRHNRMWQKQALDQIVSDLKKQIHVWHEKRRVAA